MPKVYLSPERRPAPHAPYYGFPGVYEHDVCVEIGAYCAEALTRCGFDVMVASPNKTMQERVAESIAWKSNLHMPIHTNASTATLKEGTAQGPTVLRYGRAGGISDRACQMVYRRLMEIYPRNTHRGVYQKDEFYEIGRTPMLSIYPEIAFHDNGQDAIWIVQNKSALPRHSAKVYATGSALPTKRKKNRRQIMISWSPSWKTSKKNTEPNTPARRRCVGEF